MTCVTKSGRRLETETVWVCVTEKDIWKGLARSCSMCPVARAINRRMGDGWKVTVHALASRGSAWCRIHFENDCGGLGAELTSVDISRRVGNLVRKFDAGFIVRPTRFQMELPSVCLT